MPPFLRPENRRAVAAIDLGSNALRAVIVRPVKNRLHVVAEFREPLRLGEDVFKNGTISVPKIAATEDVFIRLLHLFAAHGVEDVRAIATSAMRDAKNAPLVVQRVEQATGIRIESISGLEEARLIHRAVGTEVPLKGKNAVLMDVGGGSTEITLVKKGKFVASRSFDVGTVRLLGLARQRDLDERVQAHVANIMRFIDAHLPHHDLFVGTGGNLRRIGKIRKKILGKSAEECLYREVAHMADTLFGMSFIERVRNLSLDPDRADVILPATMLVRTLMEALGADKILLPKVGLKEGVVLSMVDGGRQRFVFRD